MYLNKRLTDLLVVRFRDRVFWIRKSNGFKVHNDHIGWNGAPSFRLGFAVSADNGQEHIGLIFLSLSVFSKLRHFDHNVKYFVITG